MTIFKNRTAIVSELRADRLALAASSVLPNVAVSDDFIYSKVLAAEAEIARRLRVHLEPTIIVPDDAAQTELDALAAAGQPWSQEAAYDYETDFFIGDKWGYIITRNKPIVSVQSLKFVYPSALNQVFTIPPEWIRMDRKFGHIRLVPATQAFAAPLGAFLIQALSGGRLIPFMIQLRYTAGLQNVAMNWPDIMDVIKKRAVVGMITDAFLPQSGSISADGLSQSLSVDVEKYHESIDRAIDGPKGSNGGLISAIHGVRIGVM
jgi:hypothetical protein